MSCKKSIIQKKEQPSALKIALITAGILITITASLIIIYNFFKKHFKISFEYDCDGSCDSCGDTCDDELFADCEFYPEGDGSYIPEVEEVEIVEENE